MFSLICIYHSCFCLFVFSEVDSDLGTEDLSPQRSEIHDDSSLEQGIQVSDTEISCKEEISSTKSHLLVLKSEQTIDLSKATKDEPDAIQVGPCFPIHL